MNIVFLIVLTLLSVLVYWSAIARNDVTALIVAFAMIVASVVLWAEKAIVHLL